jgi:DNA polymerase-3 subunit epsilon
LGDARATAELLRSLASAFGGFDEIVQQAGVSEHLAGVHVPSLAPRRVACAHRGQADANHVPYLNRLAKQLPAVSGPDQHTEYLALIDRVLIDRVISARETDQLVSVAADLGIDRPTAAKLGAGYLEALADAAVADGQVTDGELEDLGAVATLLGLNPDVVGLALDRAWHEAARKHQNHSESGSASNAPTVGSGFSLTPGDMVVFTGQMSRPREELEQMAVDAGLVPHSGVTKKVAVVVAADPDSLSSKARKAADYGITIINEAAFLQLMDAGLGATRQAS